MDMRLDSIKMAGYCAYVVSEREDKPHTRTGVVTCSFQAKSKSIFVQLSFLPRSDCMLICEVIFYGTRGPNDEKSISY